MASSSSMHQATNWQLYLCIALFLCFASGGAFAQQSYAGTVGGDCSSGSTTSTSVTVGYTCSQTLPTCQTYGYYRTQQSQSLSDVASLFGSNISALATANSLSSTSSLSFNQPLFIPINCSCTSSNYSLMGISYTIQSGDTMYKIANSTYQGLTTCSGIQTSNPSVSATGLSIGSSLIIPLRCACPSEAQLNQNINLLITYPIVSGDDLSTIGSAFGANISLFQATNNLSQTNSVIHPQTTVLIPLAQKPQTTPSLGANVSSTSPPSTPTSQKSSRVGMYVGIGIAIAACFAGFLIVLAIFYVKKGKFKFTHDTPLSEAGLMQESDAKSSSFFKKHEIDMREINHKLPSYSTDEIIVATQGFDASNHINGSVYRGMLRDQMVAIKKIDRNISKEISIFKSLHHSNLVPLMGFCIGSQESFLVYPLIGEGSLKDWLHEFPHKETSSCLSWSVRLRIAADIANALEYLHDYTKPSFLHKNIASSNILVDGNFRGKLSNFGLAKSTENMEQGLAWTSHIEGTQGYLAPEYMNDGLLSSKTDVFAFGVVLLEMLSGEFPIIRDNEGLQLPGKHGFLWESISTILQGDDTLAQENLGNWIDPMLNGQYPMHCTTKMFLLAKRCVAKDPALRPSMSYTASILVEIMEASQKWECGAHEGMLGR